jgi:hypothetical protein
MYKNITVCYGKNVFNDWPVRMGVATALSEINSYSIVML